MSAHKTRHVFFTSVLACLAGLALTAWAIEARAAEYRLQSGDVLEFSAVGLPELQKRITINVDGLAAFPLIEGLQAAGLTISELRRKVQEVLPQRTYRYRTSDGRESFALINGDEVVLDIAEYRPIYASGDVAKPGELKYRAGLTVQQAIVLAGGVDMLRGASASPVTQIADLRAEYEALSAEYVKRSARLWRLQTELAGEPQLVLADAPVALASFSAEKSMLSEAQHLEVDQFNVRRDDLERERAFFERAIAKAENHKTLLDDQQKQESEAAKLDTDELTAIQGLFKKGLVPITRLATARRAVFASTTRMMQTRVQLAQVTRDYDVASRSLEKLGDQRRIEILKDVQESTLALDRLRPRLDAVKQNIVYVSSGKSRLQGADGQKPDIYVYRKAESGHSRFAADDYTELLPGDVVEVVVKMDALFNSPSEMNVNFNGATAQNLR